jgi:hypothetical protein
MEDTEELGVNITANLYMTKTWLVALYDRHVNNWFMFTEVHHMSVDYLCITIRAQSVTAN